MLTLLVAGGVGYLWGHNSSPTTSVVLSSTTTTEPMPLVLDCSGTVAPRFEPKRLHHRVWYRRHRGNRHHLDLLERRECLRIRDFEDGHLQPKLRQRGFHQHTDTHLAW